MLESGVAVGMKNRRGGTPLYDFTFSNNCTSGILRKFLCFDTDLDVRDGGGWTPLHWLVRSGNIEMIDAFTQHGANLDIRSDMGATSLTFALSRHEYHAFKRIIQLGADCTVSSQLGSMLHVVARDGDIETIHYLRRISLRHIDRDGRDNDGFTALELAERRRDGTIEYTDICAPKPPQIPDLAAWFEAFLSLIRSLDFPATDATERMPSQTLERHLNGFRPLQEPSSAGMAHVQAADVEDSDCEVFVDARDGLIPPTS